MSELKLLQITDLHQRAALGATLLDVDTGASLEKVLRQALAETRPDALLVTGDVAHDPEPEVYLRTIRLLESHYGGPWLWTPGNHDLTAAMDEAVLEAGRTAERLREHRMGDWAVLMLDTHAEDRVGGLIADAELERLADRLARSEARHIVVAGHHLPVTIGTPWLDEHRIENSDALLALLARHGNVRAYLCGHVHQSVHETRAGLAIMATPSTCFQFTPGCSDFSVDDRPPAWRWLSLSPSGAIETRIAWARR